MFPDAKEMFNDVSVEGSYKDLGNGKLEVDIESVGKQEINFEIKGDELHLTDEEGAVDILKAVK